MRNYLLNNELPVTTPEITPEQQTLKKEKLARGVEKKLETIFEETDSDLVEERLEELPQQLQELFIKSDNDSRKIEKLMEQIEQLNKENSHLKKVVYKSAEQPADLRSKSPIVRKQGADKSGMGRA